MSAIDFEIHEIEFDVTSLALHKAWISATAIKENCIIEELSYIFTSDEFLLSLNQKYLGHNTFTDIITFDYSTQPGNLSGEIYISIDRVKENAMKFGVTFQQELSRVIVHGLLHLIGYNDKSPKQKGLMREKEDTYISLLQN